METILQGIPRVQCPLDDIVVAGEDEEKHMMLLEKDLKRLYQYNLKEKCTNYRILWSLH